MDLIRARKELENRRKLRDLLLQEQREIVRECASAIRMVHAGKEKSAKKRLGTIQKRIAKAEKKAGSIELRRRVLGLCYQEYTELAVLISVVECKNLPKLNVPAEFYILGVLDAIGEMKRVVMTKLLENDVKGALKLYTKMEDIYYELDVLSFPSSIVPGLKPKQDAMKRVLEGLYMVLVEAQIRVR